VLHLPSSDAASDHLEQRSCSWRATVRGGHDDIGEGWCSTCPHRMPHPTNANMTHVCVSKSNSRHLDVSRSLPLCCDSLRATVCGGHEDVGEGWCFTCPLWMLRPTNAAMEHLCASQPYYFDVFSFFLCMEQRSWRATVRGGHDDIGEGRCFICPHRMLRPTNVTMIHVCASKPYSRHPHVLRSVSLCRDSLRATVCGGHDGIGEGWCFTCPVWMLHPTNIAMEHLLVGGKTGAGGC
jgi:hypothetical protein